MHKTIQYDLEELLTVFDDLSPLTNEEQRVYWLTYSRADGTQLKVNFSVYECHASVIIRTDANHYPASLHLPGCQYVRVLDKPRRVIELAFKHEGAILGIRCVLSLDDTNLMEITEFAGDK